MANTSTDNIDDLDLSDFLSAKPIPEMPLKPVNIDFPAYLYHSTKTTETIRSANNAVIIYNRTARSPVYFKDGVLVEVRENERGEPFIEKIDRSRLDRILSSVGTWKDFATNKEVPLTKRMLEYILRAPPDEMPGVLPLAGIRTGALLTESGVVAEKGYNPETRLYLTTSYTVDSVPENPGEADIARARGIIHSLIHEFRFESPVDYANTVLALTTLVLRPTLAGPVPIWIVDKNISGAGGTLLCQTVGAAALGVIPQVSMTTGRPDEMDKQVRASLLGGEQFIIYDNVASGTNWAPESLLSATSGTGEASGRNMGTYASCRCSAGHTMFAVNGINIPIRADVVRRMYRTRLKTKRALTEGEKFSRTKTQLYRDAVASHPLVVWAVSVFQQAWISAGRPVPRMRGNLDEYPDWHDRAVGMLAAAGYECCLENQDELQADENEEDAERREVIRVLYEVFKTAEFKPQAVLKLMAVEGSKRRDGVYEGLLNYAPEKFAEGAVRGTLTVSEIGKWLKEFVDSKYSRCPWYLTRSRKNAGTYYQIQPVESQEVLVKGE